MTTPTPPSALPEAVAWEVRYGTDLRCWNAYLTKQNADDTAKGWRGKVAPLYTAAQLTARDAQWREVVEGLTKDADELLAALLKIDASGYYTTGDRDTLRAVIDKHAARAKESP